MSIDSRDALTIAFSLFGLFVGGLFWVLLGEAGFPVGPGFVWGIVGLILGAYVGVRATVSNADI